MPTPPEVENTMKAKKKEHKHLLAVSRYPSASDIDLSAAQVNYKSAKADNQRKVEYIKYINNFFGCGIDFFLVGGSPFFLLHKKA